MKIRIISFGAAVLCLTASFLAKADSYIMVDDWKSSRVCAKPSPVCCQGSGCETLNSESCTELPANQVVSYCSDTSTEKFGWSAAEPCSIIGSYRDIGLKASTGCNSNQNSIYTSARVNPLCSSLLIQGNQLLGVSQTKGYGSIVWDFGKLPDSISSFDSKGLAHSAVVSALGSEIRLGSGILNIPVCHKINPGDPRPKLKVELYFSDGSSYIQTSAQNSSLELSNSSCASVDSDLSFTCPKFNTLNVQIPAQYTSKILGAIKIDFENVSKLFLGQVTVSCSGNNTISEDGKISGTRVYSCKQSVPACVTTPVPDCAGNTGGSAKVDKCGVCNGDGSTCSGCDSLDIKETQRAVDSNADALRDAGLKALQQLTNAAKSAKLSAKDSKIMNEYAANAKDSITRYFSVAWSEVWKLPNVVLTCSSSLCVSVSNVQTKLAISEANEAMLSIAQGIQKKSQELLSKAKKNKSSNLKAVNKALTEIKKINKDMKNLNKNGLAELNKIPNQHSQCK